MATTKRKRPVPVVTMYRMYLIRPDGEEVPTKSVLCRAAKDGYLSGFNTGWRQGQTRARAKRILVRD